MFPPAPYFEELPIRLEIEWGGRLRPIETRVEQWPNSNKNVLVCHFMDEPEYGEWVIMVAGGLPHFISPPDKLLHKDAAWRVATRERCLVFSFKQERIEKLLSIIQRAFEGDNFHIARILQLPPWQNKPRLLIWSPKGALWAQDWTLQNTTPFDWSPAPLHLTPEQMLDIAETKWNEPESELRFAWQWANWNDSERFKQTTGAKGDATELEKIMEWALTCSSQLWTRGTWWQWSLWRATQEQIDSDAAVHSLWNYSDTQGEEDGFMKPWSDFLRLHFIPQWRSDWLDKHTCVRIFWRNYHICTIELTSPPTKHEQLEARLLLRDWLQENSPDRMDLLESS